MIAFPCNQFGGQAPLGSEGERAYGYRKFGIDTFPIMDEIEVNGPNAHPIYKFLKQRQPVSLPSTYKSPTGAEIEWNYTKFLIDRNGQPVKRFKSAFDPTDFEGDVRLVLAGKETLPAECILHPGRMICKVEKRLAA